MKPAASAAARARGPQPLRPLPRAFHERPVVELAAALLGQLLVRRVDGRDGDHLLVGRIVETEAYGGAGIDPSAHSFRGSTPRCAVMFGPAGHAYVYATQGACSCLNVTAQGDAAGKAVLIRAVEPVLGHDAMRAARLARLPGGPTRARLLAGRDHELAQGPGRLCLCLGIERALDGVDLTSARSPLWIAASEAVPSARVRWTPRIGLNPASASFGWRWRAIDAASLAVSVVSPRPEPARTPRPARCPRGR